jgi:hypothetical protein
VLEVIVSLSQEPTACEALVELIPDQLRSENYSARDLHEWLVAAIFRLGNQACQHEHEDLSRQGAAKYPGFVMTMRKCGLIQLDDADGAEEVAEVMIRKRFRTKGSPLKAKPQADDHARTGSLQAAQCWSTHRHSDKTARTVRLGTLQQVFVVNERVEQLLELVALRPHSLAPTVRSAFDVQVHMAAYKTFLASLPGRQVSAALDDAWRTVCLMCLCVRICVVMAVWFLSGAHSQTMQHRRQDTHTTLPKSYTPTATIQTRHSCNI